MQTARWGMVLLVGTISGGSLMGGSLALAQDVKIVEGPKVPMGKTVVTAERRLRRLFGTPALAPLHEPDLAEALPVRIVGDVKSSDFRITERPVALGPKAMGDLRQTLSNPDSFGVGVSACMFHPDVAFRFRKGSESVQVIVCFSCGEAIFQNAAGRDLTDRLNIVEIRSKLLAIARKAFPKDKALQEHQDWR